MCFGSGLPVTSYQMLRSCLRDIDGAIGAYGSKNPAAFWASRSGRVLRQNLSGVSSVVVANGSGVNRHDEREGRAAGMFRRTRVRSHVTRTLTCTVQQTR